MADPSRITFTPVAEQSLMLQGGVNYKGSGVGHVTFVGYLPAGSSSTGIEQLYRDLIRFPIEWPADMYQIVDAFIDFTPQATSLGASPRIDIARLQGTTGEAAFTVVGGVALGNVYTDNDPDDAANWAASLFVGTNVAIPTFSDPTAKPTRCRIPGIIEDIAPARVKKRSGVPCGALEDFGLVVHAHDETTGANRWSYWTSHGTSASVWPRLTILYDASVPPGVPTIVSPVPSTTGTIVPSVDARRLTVDLVSNLPAARAQVEVYADGATVADETSDAQAVTGTLVATSGPVVPTSTGETNRYTVSLTGLRPRVYQLVRARTQNAKGVWGRWTALADGRIFPAYTPGVPLDPRMTSDPASPVISATLNSPLDPQDGVTGLTGTFVRHNTDGSTTNLWPTLSTIGIGYVAGTKRAEVPWGGIGLNDGDAVSWRVALTNRDGVVSPLTPEITTVMHSPTGPTFTPADATTKLTSRRTGVTIDDPIEFDAYRYRLYRNDVLFYSSPIIGVDPADTTADITFPVGVLNWGDTFGIEAETRPTDTTVFGPTSPRAVLYVNALPVTSLTPLDGDGVTGTVLGTEDIIWRTPYQDPDVARYGERPVAKMIEIRHAATPQGSGSLVEQRLGVEALKAIADDEHSGYQMDALTSTTAWTPDAGVTLATVADQPTDYTGNSLQLTFASSGTGRGAVLTFDEPLDLRGFSSHAILLLWGKLSSEANLDHLGAGFYDSDDRWVEWTVYDPAADATGAWDARFPRLGFPDDSGGPAGDFDWSSVPYFYVWAYLSGTFAGTVRLRDLHIGALVKDTTPSDASLGIAFENSYDARARYRDDADALVATTLAATASATDTNVKVDSVTGLVAGQDITIDDDDSAFQETRTIATVGTAGSGGTGVTLTGALLQGHPSGNAATVYPWGPWTAWRTVRSSEPPTVVATSPADDATITDPTPAFTFTFTSPAGKDMAMHTFRLYRREDDVDRLVYERDVLGASLTVTGPAFLLEDATDYAWQIDGYDEDGLVGSTDRQAFTTAFTTPDALTDVTGTADPVRGWITLAWTPSTDDDLAFHVVRWRDADGQLRRVDLGPRTLDDGRSPLLAGTFTYRGGRLGSNIFQVSVHNGAQESDPQEVEVILQPARGGAWMLKVDDERGLSWPVDPTGTPRTPQATVETFRPPGRPFPVHHHWGTSGRSASVRLRYLSSEMSLARAVAAMLGAGTPVWLAAAEPYDFDVMRARVVGSGTEDPQPSGFVDLSIDLDEIAPEVSA